MHTFSSVHDFEHSIRQAIRAELSRLNDATDNEDTYYNNITYYHTRSGGKWSVQIGKNHEESFTLVGEVLCAVVSLVIQTYHGKASTKLTLLESPVADEGPF